MNKNLIVKVTYRNDKLEPTYEKSYSLSEYTDMMRQDLLRVITDIEDMVYESNGNKMKSDWPDDVWADFCRIKHKMLDKAGDIGRLPQNITVVEDAVLNPLETGGDADGESNVGEKR